MELGLIHVLERSVIEPARLRGIDGIRAWVWVGMAVCIGVGAAAIVGTALGVAIGAGVAGGIGAVRSSVSRQISISSMRTSEPWRDSKAILPWSKGFSSVKSNSSTPSTNTCRCPAKPLISTVCQVFRG